jgi:metallo-beta-lactamase family protein
MGPEWTSLSEACRFKLYDAGHILGSAVTVLETTENGATHRLAFTGDLGNTHVPILQEPEKIKESVETLIMECTYGNRIHRPVAEVDTLLTEVITDAVKHKRKIIVPAFALGRTQELIYALHKLYDGGHIPQIPIYVDSPLSNDITQVFSQHYDDFDEESWKDFFSKHESPFAFSNLHLISSTEESKKLNEISGPCIIIASSGMCEGGRILHHLQHNVYNPNSVIIITGYQAEHTLGRKLVEGVSPVTIYNRSYEVRAKILTINEFSAHADQTGLFNYVASIKDLKNVFLVHSEFLPASSVYQEIQSMPR